MNYKNYLDNYIDSMIDIRVKEFFDLYIIIYGKTISQLQFRTHVKNTHTFKDLEVNTTYHIYIEDEVFTSTHKKMRDIIINFEKYKKLKLLQ